MSNELLILLLSLTCIHCKVILHEASPLLTWQPVVNGTEKLCDDVNQYSGYFSAGGSKNYFFWFFESRATPKTDPTVMWLNGGPGCSSLLGLFTENGPCTIDKDTLQTKTNPNSWNKNANLLYVDQPPGTGFSNGTWDHGEAGVAKDMYTFLQAFFEHFPEYNRNFHIFGESYAGHYVPAISHQIFEGNKNSNNVKIDMKGVGIGNGLTDPLLQYPQYPKMAFNSTTAPSVVSKTGYGVMKAAVPLCTKQISACNNNGTVTCVSAFTSCNLGLVTPVQLTGVNLYDLRIKCEKPPLCYDFSQVGKYLNQKSVKEALGVTKRWKDCNMAVNKMFTMDWMERFQDLLIPQLEGGINVLIYAGDQDYICNWLGNKAWTLDLAWSGKDEFNKAEDREVGTPPIGKIREYKNFIFAQIYKAGHMAPRDQPEAMLSVLDQFLNMPKTE